MTPRTRRPRPGIGYPLTDTAIHELATLVAETRDWYIARHRYTDTVWESDLPPVPRLVALAYARHSHRDHDTATLAYHRIRALTGIASNGTIAKAIRTLIDRGWLQPDTANLPRGRRARYQLTIPPTGDTAP